MNTEDVLDDLERGKLKSDHELEAYITAHHSRFHKLLFWADVAVLLNFFVVMSRIVRLYDNNNINWLTVALLLIFGMLTILLIKQWRKETSLGGPRSTRLQIMLHYKMSITNKQACLIISYLAAYTLMLITGYIFFTLTGVTSPNRVFEITSGVSFVMYGAGTYMLYKSIIGKRMLAGALKQAGQQQQHNMGN